MLPSPAPDRLSLLGPGDWRQVSLSPDGNLLAAAQFEGKVALLPLDPPGTPRWLPERSGVFKVAVSPDRRWVATASYMYPGVWIWDVGSGKRVRELPSDGRSDLDFSPDGRWLLVSGSNEFRLWRAGSWPPGLRIRRHGSVAGRGPQAFTRDGKLLALAASGRVIQLVRPTSSEPLATLEPPEQVILAYLAFNADGSLLAAATENQVIYLWDLRFIRQQLAAMGLDWTPSAYPRTAPAAKGRLRQRGGDRRRVSAGPHE